MDAFIRGILKHRKAVVAVFLVCALVGACCIPFVKTNYNMVDYLPESAQSTTAVKIMNEQFDQGIPNATVLIHDVDIPRALALKAQISAIEGVEGVMWLDDMVDLTQPLATLDQDTVESYYKDSAALYQVTVADTKEASVIKQLRELADAESAASLAAGGAGTPNAVAGEAMDTAQMQASTIEEVLGAVIIIVPIILFLLIISTMSWIEPVLFIAAIGVSILFNMGTNLIFGSVSFITYSVSPILQLAVSLDYAIFLLHAFARWRERVEDVEDAMAKAMRESMATIAASATTTMFGFAALAFMQFEIGADLGINLVKGIVFSFITVVIFLPALTLILYRWIDKTAHRKFMPSFANVGNVLGKIRIPAMLLVFVLIVPAFLGQQNTAFTYQNGLPDPNIRAGADTIMTNEEFGQQNNAVILVPRGNAAQELALSEAVAEVDNVKSVVSYASTVGVTIPEGFLDDSVVEQFYSDDWARIIGYVDTPVESEEAFTTVQAIMDTAAQYYDEFYIAGQSANLYDMKQVIEVDNIVVSLVAIIAVFLIVALTFKSLALPILLVLTIESGIWINLAIPYFMGDQINFIGYLIVNTVQLGATIDYAILLTTRYMEHRKSALPRKAIHAALAEAFPSLLVSAGILATAGFALAATSSLSAVSTLGLLLGRGALMSLVLVTCFLPGLLIYCDGFVRRTTWRANFLLKEKSHETS